MEEPVSSNMDTDNNTSLPAVLPGIIPDSHLPIADEPLQIEKSTISEPAQTGMDSSGQFQGWPPLQFYRHLLCYISLNICGIWLLASYEKFVHVLSIARNLLVSFHHFSCWHHFPF